LLQDLDAATEQLGALNCESGRFAEPQTGPGTERYSHSVSRGDGVGERDDLDRFQWRQDTGRHLRELNTRRRVERDNAVLDCRGQHGPQHGNDSFDGRGGAFCRLDRDERLDVRSPERADTAVT
jgi:hypothetical protein